MTFKSLLKKEHLLGLTAIALFAVSSASIPTTYAEETEDPVCYGSYGDEIPCPVVNKSFAVEKVARRKGKEQWKDEVAGLGEKVEVEFRLTVENVGDVEVNELKVIDTLPANLDYVSADPLPNDVQPAEANTTLVWMINEFKPGDKETFVITAKTNLKGLDEGMEKCVVNVVDLDYQGNHEGSDTATVCIKHGEVEGAEELPDTSALTELQITLISTMAVVSGMFTTVAVGNRRKEKK